MAFASPSIVRASVFFSIFTIGKFFGGNTFMLNTIAGGVLILLLFDIKGINGIGIQLSYAAVIGIHLFYKPFIKLIHINNPIVKFCWSNCCLSLAAQITTLPILAIHFHQIAGWVLVSNFIMVPLSNIILYALAILLLLPLKFDIALTWGQLTESYILFFNQTVRNWFMATKAGTVQISMGKSEICLYYIILLFVYLWLYFKRPGLILVVLGCICAYTQLKLFS
jgi:competence protein ComEC